MRSHSSSLHVRHVITHRRTLSEVGNARPRIYVGLSENHVASSSMDTRSAFQLDKARKSVWTDVRRARVPDHQPGLNRKLGTRIVSPPSLCHIHQHPYTLSRNPPFWHPLSLGIYIRIQKRNAIRWNLRAIIFGDFHRIRCQPENVVAMEDWHSSRQEGVSCVSWVRPRAM